MLGCNPQKTPPVPPSLCSRTRPPHHACLPGGLPLRTYALACATVAGGVREQGFGTGDVGCRLGRPEPGVGAQHRHQRRGGAGQRHPGTGLVHGAVGNRHCGAQRHRRHASGRCGQIAARVRALEVAARWPLPATLRSPIRCKVFTRSLRVVPTLSPPAGSFYQHGPLLQTASYGQSYTGSMVGLVTQAAGTAFAIPPGPTDALTTLLLDGQQYSLRTAADGSRRTSWDLLPEGRQVRWVWVGRLGCAASLGCDHLPFNPTPAPDPAASTEVCALFRHGCLAAKWHDAG